MTFLRVLIRECQRLHNWRMDGLQKWICGGEQSHAYIIQAPNWNTIDFLWWNTLTSGTVTLLHVLSVSARAAQLEDGWSQMNCVRDSISCLHNQHPIETQLTPCDGIHWHQVQWHYYMYWFCECQSCTTGGWMVFKWIVWGEQSHAYIIKHPIETQLTSCDGIHWHQVQWHYYGVLILWVPEQHNWGRMVSKWIVWGRAVSCLHNQAPNWNTIDSLWWIHWHQVQWHYYMYWFCECQSCTTGGRMVFKWIVWGEQSHAYIIKHPIETQLTSCDGIHWHQVQWHYYVYWFCECQSSTTGGQDGLQMNCVGESSLMLT